jgi:hypothetical protein
MAHTLDAPKVLSDLRDQLARHDKPIGFLFGAGTSCAINVPKVGSPTVMEPLIPNVASLTNLCKIEVGNLGATFAKAWTSVESDCRPAVSNPNVETILSRLRMMLGAIGDGDTLVGLKNSELSTFEETVRRTIARLAMPAPARIPEDLPHRQLAKWLGRTTRLQPIEIFTVNYDVLIELALEAERIPLFDGFVGSYRPFFHADSLRRSEAAPGVTWTRLWKMHGSVTWRREKYGENSRIVRGEPDASGEMIFPSFQKYDESRQQPYAAFMDRLGRFLDQDDALLIVCGFSFSDEHINNVIFGTLENRPRTHVYALQHGEHEETTDLIKRAYQRRNMIVVGPDTGVIGGRRGTWRSEKDHSFAKSFFDGPTTGGSTSAGKMKIGDFSRFCDFLSSMMAG